MKRTVTMLVLALLLLCASFLVFDVKFAHAWTGTVYIKADGSVEPSDAPVERNGDLYTLTEDIISDGDGIVIEKNNAVIEGARHIVQASGFWGTGIEVNKRSNVTIKNIRINGFDYGIHLSESYYINIVQSDITKGASANVFCYGSSCCTFSENNISESSWFGIIMYYSFSSGIFNNRIIDNARSGVELFLFSANNSVMQNRIENNWAGVCLNASAANNAVRENDIITNNAGIRLYDSSYNFILCNSFINNTFQVYDHSVEGYVPPSVNIWNGIYPYGGNYWSDYAGVDNFSGPYQNETGEDGIGDIPHIINALNKDDYPLMRAYTSLRVQIYTDKATYHSGELMHLGLHITNLGETIRSCVAIWLELPDGSIHVIIHAHNKELQNGLNYNNPSFKSFTLPSITPGTYKWHAALLNPSTHTRIIEDAEEWTFN